MSRARSVEIYLKPGIEEDDQVHATWMALRGCARPQDIFRRALRMGLREMAERGELPRAVSGQDGLGLPAPRAPAVRGRAGARPGHVPEPAPGLAAQEARAPAAAAALTDLSITGTRGAYPLPAERPAADGPVANPRPRKLGQMM